MLYKPGNPRYERQVTLKELGEDGQQKLAEAKVLVIGAGGLGCPALQYLAGAGVGTLGIVDHDTVALNNLHRQVLYTTSDIGSAKAQKAASLLLQQNPDITIIPYQLMLAPGNAFDLISGYDLVIDGTDNFATRYLVNDACVLLGKPFIHGAISRFEGQVALFNAFDVKGERSANYRDLFPAPPDEGAVLNCAEAGVIGTLPGIIGSMMASEAIKLITGIGTASVNKLFTYNSLSNQMYDFDIAARPETRQMIPQNRTDFEMTDYQYLCSGISVKELDPADLYLYINKANTVIVDIREPGEMPPVDELDHIDIPLSELRVQAAIPVRDKVILFCQTGKRGKIAADLLPKAIYREVMNLKGGILAWKKLNTVK